MRAKVVLFARVKDLARESGYRFESVNIKRGRPAAIPGATSFYLRYQCHGKRVVKAVGSDLETAFIAFENHTRNLPALQRGESITHGLLQDFQQNAGGVTLAEASETYISQLQGKAESTVVAYRFAVTEFVRVVGENVRLQAVDRGTMLRYREYLYTQDLNETTRHSRLLKVVIFLKSSGVEKLLRKTDWPKINERVPQSYSQDETNRLLAVSTGEGRLLWEFFLVSGARNAEVQHVVKGDIRISNEIATLNIRAKPELGWKTKSRRDRVVRLPIEYARRLLAARTESPEGSLLFPNSQGGLNGHFDVILRRVARKAGLGGRIDCHKFRSTAATRWHANGMSIQDVKGMLGHQSIETTMRYLSASHPESEAVGKAVEQAFNS